MQDWSRRDARCSANDQEEIESKKLKNKRLDFYFQLFIFVVKCLKKDDQFHDLRIKMV